MKGLKFNKAVNSLGIMSKELLKTVSEGKTPEPSKSSYRAAKGIQRLSEFFSDYAPKLNKDSKTWNVIGVLKYPTEIEIGIYRSYLLYINLSKLILIYYIYIGYT